MVDELIEFIDYQLHSAKVDMSHINRPVFVQDLIIFMLYLFHEKTNQRFELKNKQLLDGTLNDLNQVKQNVLDQINEDAIGDQQAKLFRQIVGKEIIREVERIYRQTFLEEIRSKIFQYCPIDPTDITRQIYFESINSWPVNPTNILKLVSDPEHYCLQKVNSRIKDLFHQFIRIYSDEINTNVTSCMLIMRDVVLHSDWTDVYELHKRVLREVSYYKKD
jgi:primosomal protein N'